MVAPAQHSPAGRVPRGFTLIELLIVIGIISVLAGLSLAAVLHAKQTALVIRAHSDLALIATSLDAYKADFGDYPRFPDAATVQAAKAAPTGTGYWLDSAADRGARLLCRALLSPGPAGTLAQANPGDDGADGPGFRARRNVIGTAAPFTLAGKVSGPYIQPDKFKVEYDPTMNWQDAKLLDLNGNPILYFPARLGATAITQANGFVLKVDPTSAAAVTPPIPQPLYNAFDNQSDTTAAAAMRPFLGQPDMQYILGDRDLSGKIDNGETATTTLPYLLWTAGPSSKYGLQIDTTSLTSIPPNQKCDAVCNFDLPADVRK